MCWLKRVNSHHFFLTQKISFALFRSLFLSFVKRRERGSETLDRSSSEFHTMTSSFSQSSSFHSSGSSQSAFVEFFAHLSEEKINHLYTISPWATLAVLRALTPLAKQYIMRCVFLPLHSVIAHEMLASWTKRGCETAHEMAIERLVQLRAFVEVESHSSEEEGKKEENASKGGGFIVHEHFRKHVKRAIERGFEDLDDEEEEKENERRKEEEEEGERKNDEYYIYHNHSV